jgi:hypothetical protein
MWLAWQPGVDAQRKASYAPEVWEGRLLSITLPVSSP